MTEKEKMLSSKPYFAMDEELFNDRQRAKELVFQLNHLAPSKVGERNEIIRRLLGKVAGDFHIEPPFYCDYGYNILAGENFYTNHNCVILDCATVRIGDNVMLGPNVQVYTAGHPVDAEIRASGLEYAIPVQIGHNVWIGGNTVVNPGVSIGDNTVIGSGSVVTKDIPGNVVAVGNPCKVLRPVTEQDRLYYFRDLRF